MFGLFKNKRIEELELALEDSKEETKDLAEYLTSSNIEVESLKKQLKETKAANLNLSSDLNMVLNTYYKMNGIVGAIGNRRGFLKEKNINENN